MASRPRAAPPIGNRIGNGTHDRAGATPRYRAMERRTARRGKSCTALYASLSTSVSGRPQAARRT
eukprot:3412538-Prymnesium_polylepis.1